MLSFFFLVGALAFLLTFLAPLQTAFTTELAYRAEQLQVGMPVPRDEAALEKQQEQSRAQAMLQAPLAPMRVLPLIHRDVFVGLLLFNIFGLVRLLIVSYFIDVLLSFDFLSGLCNAGKSAGPLGANPLSDAAEDSSRLRIRSVSDRSDGRRVQLDYLAKLLASANVAFYQYVFCNQFPRHMTQTKYNLIFHRSAMVGIASWTAKIAISALLISMISPWGREPQPCSVNWVCF
jgi:hypothetical protein